MSVRNWWKIKLQSWISVVRNYLVRKYPMKGHMWSTWLEAKKSCQLVILRVLHEKCHLARYPQNSLFSKKKKCFTKFFTHTIIPSLPMKCKECFLEIKPLQKHLKVRDCYTHNYLHIFSRLPLHLYMLERFLAQTLTTPNLSVESSFGTFGKHWKEPFSGRCNRAKKRDPKN